MWFRKNKLPWKEGFVQDLSVAGYVGVVVVFMTNAQDWLGKLDNTTGPILFLALFVTSALVCGLLVFARPYRLFLNKKGEEALELVLMTAKWLVVLLVITILGLWLR